jgi:hypothetical protein
MLTGSTASALSTGVISAYSRRHAGTASAGTNATSHWFWGARARRRDEASLRYTANGYAIHHAMSVFWATMFEAATRRTQSAARIGAAAAATAAAAYVVDYHVVPRRLNPGFESRLPPRAMFATYVAFAAGLAAARWLRARREARTETQPDRSPKRRARKATRTGRGG